MEKSVQDLRNSAQRALIGNVTPNLRLVGINIEKNDTPILEFFYDKTPTEDEEELASLTDTEFLSDFPMGFQTGFKITSLNYPEPIPKMLLKIYQRYEKNLNFDLSLNEEVTSFKENPLSDRSSFLNALQKALLGHVTPNLRAVCYEVKSEKEVTIDFYYDQKPSEEELQLVQLAIKQLKSDLPSREYSVDSKIIVIPYPKHFPKTMNLSYLRYEAPYNFK